MIHVCPLQAPLTVPQSVKAEIPSACANSGQQPLLHTCGTVSVSMAQTREQQPSRPRRPPSQTASLPVLPTIARYETISCQQRH
eukprot:6555836-Prymnesium_polylepis.1